AARRRRALEELAQSIEQSGGRVAALAGDVREEAFASALVETALKRFGGLDVAFNNAGGINWAGPVPAMSLSEWNDVLATNLSSAFLGTKYQLPALAARGGGSIIFTSTFVGYSAGMPGLAAYAAAKAGLV